MSTAIPLLYRQKKKGDKTGARHGTNQLGSCPFVGEPRGIPLLVALPVLIQGALKVVDGEEQLLGGPLIEGAEDAVVAHQRLELAAERMTLDPIYDGGSSCQFHQKSTKHKY